MNEEILKKLIIDAKKGDAEAFGKLYSEYARDLYRFALYYLRNDADAEDAVQDAALTAYRSIRSLRKHEAFRSWFFKILSNECKKRLNKKAALKTVTVEDPAVLADSVDEGANTIPDLVGLLDSLSETDREIVTLSVISGFNSSEIAAVTGMKAVTVRSRLSRSLHKLREEIEK